MYASGPVTASSNSKTAFTSPQAARKQMSHKKADLPFKILLSGEISRSLQQIVINIEMTIDLFAPDGIMNGRFLHHVGSLFVLRVACTESGWGGGHISLI